MNEDRNSDPGNLLEAFDDITPGTIMAMVEEHLSDDGRRDMYGQLGQALIQGLSVGNNDELRRVLHGWVRTLVLKHHGADDVIAKAAADDESGSRVYTIEELRARFAS